MTFHTKLRIRFFINQTSGITCVFSVNNAKVKVDSYGSLPLKKH